jgi:hypothetical protein
MTRYLVHGPCLNDLGELLFFDAWIWPFTKATIRPNNLAPNFIGYPVPETWPQPVLSGLRAARLVVTPGEVLWSQPGNPKLNESMASMEEQVSEAVALASEAILFALHTPATKADVGDWLREIDHAGRKVAARLAKRGQLVTSKQFTDGITRVFKPGWDMAMVLMLPAFPRIDRAIADIGTLQAFLRDATTQTRREALYAWPNLLGRPDVPLQSVAGQVANAIADYASWVEASGLASGRGPVELLWKADDPRHAEALAATPLSDAARGMAQFRPRGLAVGETVDSRSDTPMALVCHRPRGYPKF